MLRKFLATMAVMTMFVSQTAFALNVTPGGNQIAITSYIDNFSVNSSQFNPNQNEVAVVNYYLSNAAKVYVVAMNVSTQTNYPVLGSSVDPITQGAGNKNVTWYGTLGNINNGTLVPAGDYFVKAYALDLNDNVVDFDFEKVSVDTSPANNGGNDDGNGDDDDDGNPPVVVIGGDDDGSEVSNVTVSSNDIDVSANEEITIRFYISEDAAVTVVIKNSDGNIVRTFPAFDGDNYSTFENPLELTWDGKNDGGYDVPAGTYTVEITTENTDGTNSIDFDLVVNNANPVDNGVITDFTVDPQNDWDPTDEELEIEFELTEEVEELEVYAKKGNKEVEIYDEDNADDEDFELEWDGSDDDGDYVEEGDWQIWVKADGDQVYKTVEVKYEEPKIEEAFVTKDEFDNEEDEFTTVVFKLDEDAIVTVEVYQDGSKEEELMEEEELDGDTWYAVTWYGEDEDGDESDYDNYEFKITVENEASERVTDTQTVDFDLEEDDVSSGKSNITNDYFSPVVYDEDSLELAELHYCIDEDAEVTVEIFEGKNAGGSEEVTLMADYQQSEGCHTIEWDVNDEDGDDLDEDIYSYEITTKVGSKKEKEEGRFVIGETDDHDHSPGHGYPGVPGGSITCGGYWDAQIYAGTELCDALDWVTVNGIFKGYIDGSFGMNKYINRAETFKVVLETFDVPLFPIDGSDHGFKDVDPYEWYMPYVITAKFYGMLEGYNYGTEARLSNHINRAEILKFVLEGSKSFNAYTMPNSFGSVYSDLAGMNSTWYYPYAGVSAEYQLFDGIQMGGGLGLNPGQLVTRDEVALLLYRMYKDGLL